MFNLQPFRRKPTSLFDFDDFFNTDFFAPFKTSSRFLNADIKENTNEYVVEMDLPGVPKDAVEIDYVNNNLIIHGKRNYDNEIKEDNYIRKERSYGEFRRSFYVDDVDENKISATFKDGVLSVILPKSEKKQLNGKKIDIH